MRWALPTRQAAPHRRAATALPPNAAPARPAADLAGRDATARALAATVLPVAEKVRAERSRQEAAAALS